MSLQSERKLKVFASLFSFLFFFLFCFFGRVGFLSECFFSLVRASLPFFLGADVFSPARVSPHFTPSPYFLCFFQRKATPGAVVGAKGRQRSRETRALCFLFVCASLARSLVLAPRTLPLPPLFPLLSHSIVVSPPARDSDEDS